MGGQLSAATAHAEPSALQRLLSHILSYPAALAAGLIATVALSAFTRLEDPDLWWHLKNGEAIWNTHRIPAADLYSFTAQGHPWIAHEWLSELSLFAAYRLAGYSRSEEHTSELQSLRHLVCRL